MEAPSLFVIVPGFGKPHISEKVRILQENVARIDTFPWSRLVIKVCIYDPEAILHIPTKLRNDERIEWIVQPGIVGQFIHAYASPSQTCGFDFVLIILDDIELQPNFDFQKLIQYHGMFGFDIYSPSLTLDSKYQFNYLLTKPESIAHIFVVCACEAFCYFMPKSSYDRYYQHIEPKINPWLWGMDMCLYRCIGMKAAVINCMNMRHYYKNECYELRPDADPIVGRNHLLQKYDVTMDELVNQKAVLYYIIDGALV